MWHGVMWELVDDYDEGGWRYVVSVMVEEVPSLMMATTSSIVANRRQLWWYDDDSSLLIEEEEWCLTYSTMETLDGRRRQWLYNRLCCFTTKYYLAVKHDAERGYYLPGCHDVYRCCWWRTTVSPFKINPSRKIVASRQFLSWRNKSFLLNDEDLSLPCRPHPVCTDLLSFILPPLPPQPPSPCYKIKKAPLWVLPFVHQLT